MQHSDIEPQWHPADGGAKKKADRLQQYILMELRWDMYATGPE
jgi:hypothetical protein